jgi:hypothetical protein
VSHGLASISAAAKAEGFEVDLITDYDSYRRNPTEPKIKGQDYEFLKWARDHSQERLFRNQVRRRARATWEKYTDPARYVKKARKMLGQGQPTSGDGSVTGEVAAGEVT